MLNNIYFSKIQQSGVTLKCDSYMLCFELSSLLVNVWFQKISILPPPPQFLWKL